MDRQKRVIGYAAQRGITVDVLGSFGVTPRLTPRQQRRVHHKLRQGLYAPRPRGPVPF